MPEKTAETEVESVPVVGIIEHMALTFSTEICHDASVAWVLAESTVQLTSILE